MGLWIFFTLVAPATAASGLFFVSPIGQGSFFDLVYSVIFLFLAIHIVLVTSILIRERIEN